MARPGTLTGSPKWTSRMASIEWAKVATNSPMANWLGLSCRNVCTMRGENWPMANCTTTIVIVSTSTVRVTIDSAMALRIASAASGPPLMLWETRW